MMKLINLMFIISSSFLLINISLMSNNKIIHPIIMGVTLFFTTIMSCMHMSISMKNHWFSFLTFLILIGGMMILFLYFISFNNNMKMTMKWIYMLTMPLKMSLLIIFMLMIFLNTTLILWIFNIEELNIINKTKFNLMFMYLSKKNFTSLISMLYLLLTMSLIVKMCINNKIKLRKINYEKI